MVIRAHVAGIDPGKDVELSVSDGILHIAVERREEQRDENKTYLRRELRYGSFHRHITLPEGASEANITATYKDGVLEIRAPSPPAVMKEPRKIPVTTG